MTRASSRLHRSSPAPGRRGCSAAAAGLALAVALLATALLAAVPPASAQVSATIERVKASVVGVGTFQKTRAPAFRFLGTGFAVGDGATIVTNAHVLPPVLDAEKAETLIVLIPRPAREAQLRPVTRGASDPPHDLALLRVQGFALPALGTKESALAQPNGITYAIPSRYLIELLKVT